MVPKLRFKGFNNSWQLSTLGQIMTGFSYGLGASATKYNGKDKYLRITDIDDDNRQFNYDNLSSPNVDLSDKSKYLLRQGDIVFARTGASVGKAYLYNKKDGRVYYAGYLIKANSNKSDKVFLFTHTFTQRYWNFIKIYSMRSGQPGINTKTLKSFKIAIPTLPEQRLIGCFFSKLDKLINLQQAKCSLLKKQYKGCLQTLFPKLGILLPRCRFNGFYKIWKITTLGNVLKEVKRDKISNPHNYYLLTVKLHFKGVEKTHNRPRVTKRSRPYYMRYPGELIVGKQNFQNGGFGIAPNDVKHCIASSAIWSFHFKNNIDKYYLVNYMRNSDWLRHTTIYLNGTGQKEYGAKTFRNLKIAVPSLQEQQKIGNFFKKLVDIINLQNDKLNYLRKLKKAYLQKMFC